MAESPRIGIAGPADREADLAQAAAAGDGEAFASLYESHERAVYDLAHRITGSDCDAADATQQAFLRAMRWAAKAEEDDPAFRTQLLIATGRACHELIERSPPLQPPGPRSETPSEMLHDACMRLPVRQREAIALREVEGLSYPEIAAVIGVGSGSVPQLIARAWLNLSDELHGTGLAAIVAPTPECERALPLIAAREDGELEAGSEDDAWLDAHLAGCERCGLGVDAMHEARASYRGWAPAPVVPWLLEETMAKAAALAGVDWSEEIARALARRADPRSADVQAPRADDRPPRRRRPANRRRALATAGIAGILLGAVLAAAFIGGGTTSPGERAAGVPRAAADPGPADAGSSKRGRGERVGAASPTNGKPQATTASFTSPPQSTTPPSQPEPESGRTTAPRPAPQAERREPGGAQVKAPPPVPDTPSATPAPTQEPASAPEPAPAPADKPPEPAATTVVEEVVCSVPVELCR